MYCMLRCYSFVDNGLKYIESLYKLYILLWFAFHAMGKQYPWNPQNWAPMKSNDILQYILHDNKAP